MRIASSPGSAWRMVKNELSPWVVIGYIIPSLACRRHALMLSSCGRNYATRSNCPDTPPSHPAGHHPFIPSLLLPGVDRGAIGAQARQDHPHHNNIPDNAIHPDSGHFADTQPNRAHADHDGDHDPDADPYPDPDHLANSIPAADRDFHTHGHRLLHTNHDPDPDAERYTHPLPATHIHTNGHIHRKAHGYTGPAITHAAIITTFSTHG